MTEKTYKNKNMIRTKHNVGRMIYFESLIERERFVKLYEDKFDRYVSCEDNNLISLYIMLPKEDFDDIVRSIGLINVVKPNWKKTRFWRTKGAVV